MPKPSSATSSVQQSSATTETPDSKGLAGMGADTSPDKRLQESPTVAEHPSSPQVMEDIRNRVSAVLRQFHPEWRDEEIDKEG